MGRGYKFRNKEVDGLYYLCGEFKGANQLNGYCAADLYHSFCGLHKVGFVVSVSCFGVRVSVMFHFIFVHYTFSSVWVAEWPPFGK